MVPGLGPATAAKIVSAFGDQSLAVLSSPDAEARLASVRGLGKLTAAKLARAWDATSSERNGVAFLTRLGLKPLLARLGFARQALHAAVLGFIHPLSGQALRFASPLPDDMRELIGELRGRAEPPGDADGSIWSTSGPAR